MRLMYNPYKSNHQFSFTSILAWNLKTFKINEAQVERKNENLGEKMGFKLCTDF